MHETLADTMRDFIIERKLRGCSLRGLVVRFLKSRIKKSRLSVLRQAGPLLQFSSGVKCLRFKAKPQT